MKSSKQKKSEPKGKPPAPAGSAKQFVVWGAVVLGIIVLAVILNQKDRSVRSEPAPPTSQGEPGPSTNVNSATSQSLPDFQKLKGRWLRPDGGYVIEIKSVDNSGKLDAGYFNPKPIHVAKAEAKQEGNAMKVFIELQDVNYPGSTYTLVYVPERDVLAGAYYQALQRQTFDVFFERMK